MWLHSWSSTSLNDRFSVESSRSSPILLRGRLHSLPCRSSEMLFVQNSGEEKSLSFPHRRISSELEIKQDGLLCKRDDCEIIAKKSVSEVSKTTQNAVARVANPVEKAEQENPLNGYDFCCSDTSQSDLDSISFWFHLHRPCHSYFNHFFSFVFSFLSTHVSGSVIPSNLHDLLLAVVLSYRDVWFNHPLSFYRSRNRDHRIQ